MIALVDDEDFERVNAYKWCVSHEGRGTKYYAIRRQLIKGGKRTKKYSKKRKVHYYHYESVKIRMHRFILNMPLGKDDELVVDHLNGDSLDNRKENLEIVTQAENMNRVKNWNRKRDDITL